MKARIDQACVERAIRSIQYEGLDDEAEELKKLYADWKRLREQEDRLLKSCLKEQVEG